MNSHQKSPNKNLFNSPSQHLVSHTAMRLCSIVLEEVRSSTDQHLELLGEISKQFFSVIFDKRQIPSSEDTVSSAQKVQDVKIDEESIWSRLTSKNIAMECLQWKNNQKQLIRNILVQVIVMLLNTPSARYQNETNTARKTPLSRPVYYGKHSSSDSTVCSFQQIEQFISHNKQEFSLTGRQKTQLEKILDELRSDRAYIKKYRQEKKVNSQGLWNHFGGLLYLQRQKFDQTYIFDKVEPTHTRLMHELLARNSNNEKIIKKFNKKVHQTTSKKQLTSIHSVLQEDKENQEELEDEIRDPEQQKKILSGSTTSFSKTNNYLKSTKIYTIRSKQRIQLGASHRQWNKSTIDLKRSLIRSKVDQGFKQTNKYQSLGKNILNNIVFDPDNMLTYTKRRMVGRNSEKTLIRKFQKSSKINRVLLRVGGIRLSLQQNQGKFLHTTLMVN